MSFSYGLNPSYFSANQGCPDRHSSEAPPPYSHSVESHEMVPMAETMNRPLMQAAGQQSRPASPSQLEAGSDSGDARPSRSSRVNWKAAGVVGAVVLTEAVFTGAGAGIGYGVVKDGKSHACNTDPMTQVRSCHIRPASEAVSYGAKWGAVVGASIPPAVAIIAGTGAGFALAMSNT